MKQLKRFSLCFLLLATNAALGQTAGMLTFQAHIQPETGPPVNGAVDLEFRIFDAETLGNMIDLDGDGAVENVCGEDVTCDLGVPVSSGILSTKFGPVHPKSFDGNPRWLEVSVNGSPLSRIEMVTAPATAEQVNQPASGTPALRVEPNATALEASFLRAIARRVNSLDARNRV